MRSVILSCPGRALRLLTLLAVVVSAGCGPMMYPLARAFGGPKESELEECRVAFTEMKAGVAGGPVLVSTPIVVRQGRAAWDSQALQVLLDAVRNDVCASASEAPDSQAVPYEPMQRNQMRYAWERAHAYQEWVRTETEAEGFWLFTEILTDAEGSTIHGGQMYMIDGSDRIAYVQFVNSHHFDQAEVVGVEAFCQLLVRCLVSDLEGDAEDHFPPYYVG
jgi:hypothetical protein